MAQVTIELRNLLKIQNFNLFDFDYPVISPSWKEEFERTFIEVYYDYEIGSETPDRFKQRLKARLNLIMPRYIKKYEQSQLLVDPFILEKVEKTIKTTEGKTNNENLNVTTNSNLDGKVESTTTDYPQHAILSSDIPSLKGEDITTTSSDNTTQQSLTGGNNLDRDVFEVLTKSGNHLDLVEKLLSLQLNFTEQILKELKTLFILVY